MKRGLIRSASLRDGQLHYEVTYCDDDGKVAVTEEVKEANLGFGAFCPVTILPENKSDSQETSTVDDPLEGEIVMCSSLGSKFVYTAMISMNGSQFRYETAIDASRVKYRKVEVDKTESNEETAGNNTNAISNCKKGKIDKKDATNPQQSPTATTARIVPSSITCSDSVSKRSSIDSKDGAGDSSRKRARYPTDAKHESDGGHYTPTAANSQDSNNLKITSHPKFPNVSKLEITLPQWLQKDRQSQRRLFFFLIGKSNDCIGPRNYSLEPRDRSQTIKRINRESHCRVHVDMKEDVFVPIKIHVEPLNASTAQQDLRRARQMLQDLLLDYVGNDGCRGRLLCEIAQSCWGAHRPSHSTSNAVKDVNPLQDNPMVTFMSIVEISYEENNMKEKSFHAAHILHRPFLNDVSDVGCDLILVEKGFRVFTNLCDPYVFVYGRRYQDVDKAVQLVKDKIRHHQRVCGKCIMG
eukprot:CAMPEP_0201710630 /NCGR_PEP_ID=MMETSP0578-20130828/58724_1 /ASSEMBLY_ACC=CAM_ASM_000663 /TAXON_ID=267565 /ORGANISM="Skeletonema grethea, Strain CCMP 1804" /LENGTH=466 /DNA_ID=CAMNT_0048199661 /DNA_START=1411 /DNA_END=2811 /DNA_ORIENTATION=-